MYLIQFKKNPDDGSFHLKFSDGFEGDISLKELEDNCPCAGCKGEEVLLHTYKPVNKVNVSESGYKLEKAEQVGNYALQLYWEDGHYTGIYTWGYLKQLAMGKK